MSDAGLRRARLINFAHCGIGWWLLRSKTDPCKWRRVSDLCHDRFCVPCARTRAWRIRENLAKHIWDHPSRFLTLTLKHCDAPLRQQVDRLYKCFAKLRGRVLWRDRVRGGLATLELKWSDRSQSWHPHLHCILDAKYIPHPSLKKDWLSITGDSSVVDIRLAPSSFKAIHYLLKYVTKPMSHSLTHNPQLMVDAIDALRNRKVILTFGTCRSWKLTAIPQEDAWERVAHRNELAYAVIDGRVPQDVADWARDLDPTLPAADSIHYHPPPPDEDAEEQDLD
jgi:hypothetical protein